MSRYNKTIVSLNGLPSSAVLRNPGYGVLLQNSESWGERITYDVKDKGFLLEVCPALSESVEERSEVAVKVTCAALLQQLQNVVKVSPAASRLRGHHPSKVALTPEKLSHMVDKIAEFLGDKRCEELLSNATSSGQRFAFDTELRKLRTQIDEVIGGIVRGAELTELQKKCVDANKSFMLTDVDFSVLARTSMAAI